MGWNWHWSGRCARWRHASFLDWNVWVWSHTWTIWWMQMRVIFGSTCGSFNRAWWRWSFLGNWRFPIRTRWYIPSSRSCSFSYGIHFFLRFGRFRYRNKWNVDASDWERHRRFGPRTNLWARNNSLSRRWWDWHRFRRRSMCNWCPHWSFYLRLTWYDSRRWR